MPQVLLRQSGAALLTASKAAVIAGLPAPPSKHSLPGHFISARARLVAGGVVADVLVIRLVAAEALMLAATRSGFCCFNGGSGGSKLGVEEWPSSSQERGVGSTTSQMMSAPAIGGPAEINKAGTDDV